MLLPILYCLPNPAKNLCQLLLALCLTTFISTVQAKTADASYPQLHDFFPEADRFTDFIGSPPASEVYQGDTLIGYAFVTNDVVLIPAYSGQPVNLLIGIDTEGLIRGAIVLEHHEPILLVGIPEHKLFDFAAEHVNKYVTDRIRVGAGNQEGYINIDAITGATVTVLVVNQSIMRSARKIASSRGIIDEKLAQKAQPGRLRQDVYHEADWQTLLGEGSIRRMLLDFDRVESAFSGTAGEGLGPQAPEDCDSQTDDPACNTFIDLYYAYLNAPTIGRNLLGDYQYQWLMDQLKEGEHAVAVMGKGVYSFKGSGYVRGGIFDRVHIVQNDRTITFRDLDHHRLSDIFTDGTPDFDEMAIFIIRESAEFDPGGDWQLELLISRATGPLDSVFTSFSADYHLSDAYVERPAPPPAMEADDEPLWVGIWKNMTFQIWVLCIALGFLTLILFFQDLLVRRAQLFWLVRNGFLLFVVVFIGWYSLAQLSIVNVFTFTHAVFHGFRWETFLNDPMIFILWAFVAFTLLLWGRGVYCGWLCPYGALQELINKVARHFKVPQFEFPPLVHERLWAIKYIILIILFGMSLQSLAEAERLAEVEPFKTTIMLHFQREWAYVLYAVILLVIAVFNRKFYCKYICPLGAALAVPARLRLFDFWLRRRKECGKQCQLCALECEVQAIHKNGKINANECHFCLDCQATYWNEHKCPPLIKKRKKRDRFSGRKPATPEQATNIITSSS